MSVADRGRALEALDRLGAPVVALGSLNADLTVTTQRLPGPGETVVGSDLRILPGGKSANQAATAALLGGAHHHDWCGWARRQRPVAA